MNHRILALLSLLPLAGRGQEPDRVRAWCEDAQFLARELERLHPRPLFGLEAAEFEASLECFESGVEGWNAERATAEFLRLVALVSRAGLDGHTAAWPLQSTTCPCSSTPSRTAGSWSERTRVTKTSCARVMAVGELPIDQACERLAPFLSRDNEWSLRARLALALSRSRIACAESLAAPRFRLQTRPTRSRSDSSAASLADRMAVARRPWADLRRS